MVQCQACGHENPEGSAFCNKCGAVLEGSKSSNRFPSPAKKEPLVIHGPFMDTVLTRSHLRARMAIEIILAIACVIGGFYFGQPWWGVGLGLMALGLGYVLYLMSTEAGD